MKKDEFQQDSDELPSLPDSSSSDDEWIPKSPPNSDCSPRSLLDLGENLLPVESCVDEMDTTTAHVCDQG